MTDKTANTQTERKRKLIRAGLAKMARQTAQDLRRMERIAAEAHWLNRRDSNCGKAASLTDSIGVLISEAIRLHRQEEKELKRGAKKEGYERTCADIFARAGDAAEREGGEMSDFGETFSPIARKKHTCEWCCGPIPNGEKHKHFQGMWDGEWQNWRMHDECHAAALKDNSLHEGFTPGDGEMPERVKALMSETPGNP